VSQSSNRPPGNQPKLDPKIGQSGIRRTVGEMNKPGSKNVSKKGKNASPARILAWAAGIFGVLLVIFAIFLYIRFTSFVDSSLGGRNETSLLDPTTTRGAKPSPVASIAPIVSIPTQTPGLVAPAPNGPTIAASAPTATPTPRLESLAPIVQKIKRGEPISVMVMGYGGGNHEGRYLTDTILQLTYDPLKNAVTIVNLPRDLYVFIPYGGQKIGFWGKINSAFSYVMELNTPNGLSPRYRFDSTDPNSKIDGAVNLLKDVVENVTYTPIDYWAIFSFDGFRRFIDAIGGVYVDVDIAFDDYEYPRNDDPRIDAGVMHIHFDEGVQLMNGEKAIQYARSRKSAQDGNDFGRSRRQMRLIGAVQQRVMQPEVMLKAFNIMDALQGNIRTSLKLDEARALLDYYRSEGAANFRNMLFVPQLLTTNFLTSGSTSDGAYILFPYAGQGNYKAIQEWLQRGRDFPELRSENLKVQVQNATGQYYDTNKLTDAFDNAGLDTVQPVWSRVMTTSVIIDYSESGKSANTIKALQTQLPGLAVQTGKKPFPEAPDVVVMLGRDFLKAPSSTNNNTGGSKTTDDAFSGIVPTSTPRPRPTATTTPAR
jgi:polyisoprenyl-teichoic acid--peptidoglycan teichoic acid transferase